MLPHEGFSEVAQEQVAQEAIFRSDGSLDEEALSARFGIGIEEASQQVTFGSYTGTVAQMLDDERCPVGAMVGAAYEEEGVEGVIKKFKALHEMDSGFSVEIAETTEQREQVKKK